MDAPLFRFHDVAMVISQVFKLWSSNGDFEQSRPAKQILTTISLKSLIKDILVWLDLRFDIKSAATVNNSWMKISGNVMKYAQCMTAAYNYTVTYNESCLEPELSSDSPTYHGEYIACNSIAIRWIWCLTLIIMTPELFVFLRCLWSICFKVEARPKARSLFTVRV